MDRRIKPPPATKGRAANKAKGFFKSAWFWGCLGIVAVSTIAYLALGGGFGEEAKAPVSKPKVTKRPKARPTSRPKSKSGEAQPATVKPEELSPPAPPQPPPPPSNDVGRVVKDAFGREFKIEAVVAPRGPRRNGVEIIRDRRLFVSNAENALDGIVNQEMGDRFLGDFDEKQFEKEFLASIPNKIEVTDEDNEDEARRKLEMIDMKKELFAAYKRGESIGEIVKRVRDEVNKAADLRDNLIAELVEIKKSQASPQEIEDFYAAANKILAEKGVRPLYSPATIKQKLQEAKQRKLAERESRK